MAHALQITTLKQDFDRKTRSFTTVILADQISSFEYLPEMNALSVYMKSGTKHDFTKLTKQQGDELYGLLISSLVEINYVTADLQIQHQ